MSRPTETGIDQDFIDSFRQPAARENRIQDLNPISIVLILLSLAVAAVAVPGIIAPACICVLYVLIALLAGLGRKFISAYSKLFLVVGIILFVLRAAFIPGANILFTLGPITVSEAGVLEGLRFTFVVMALSGAVVLFFIVTPIKNLMLAMEVAGVTPRITYVILASFQSIIDIGRNSKTVMDAQKSRGIETEGSFKNRVMAFVPILAPVFLSAMSETEERALALDARAFNSRTQHSHLVHLRSVRAGEIVVVCIFVAAAVLSIVGAVLIWN